MDEFSASARMNHYEIGRHARDYSALKRIADELHLSAAYFYAEDNRLAEIIKAFSQLDENARAKLYDAAIACGQEPNKYKL